MVVTAALVLAAAPAFAADPKETARVRLEEGSALYRKGDYPGALRKFEEARALFPSAKIFFNLGQALNRLGRPAAAVDAFQRFLDEAADADPARRADAAKFLTELEPRIGRVRVIAPPGSEITVDGRSAGVAPLARTVPVDPGSHQLTARAPGASLAAVRTVNVSIGEVVEWQVNEKVEPIAGAPVNPGGAAQTPPTLGVPAPAPQPVAPGVPSVAAGTPSAVIETGPTADRSVSRRHLPWMIGGAAVVVAGVVTAVLLTRGDDSPSGSLGQADWRMRGF